LEFLNQGRCLFVGNSNTKAQQVISHSNAFFKEILSSSTGLIKPASQLYMDKKFLDTVRFEPLYLKQFGEK
jgi:aminoglycoside N3'-acetyltransferase